MKNKRLSYVVILGSTLWAVLILGVCAVAQNPTNCAGVDNGSASVTTTQQTCTMTAGETFIVTLEGIGLSASTGFTISDTQGNTFWQVNGDFNGDGSFVHCSAGPCVGSWFIPNVRASGSDTITVRWQGGATYVGQLGAHVFGMQVADPWDGSATAVGSGVSPANSGAASGHSQNSNDIVYSVCNEQPNKTSAGAGFTTLDTSLGNTISQWRTGPGNSNSTCTWSGNASWWMAETITLRPSGTYTSLARRQARSVGVINGRSCVIPIVTTPGGTLLYAQGQVNGQYISVGLTDSGNHTWTNLVSLNQGACFTGAHTAACTAGYLANAPAGITSVTMTIDPVNDNGSCSVAEYANVATSSPLDQAGVVKATTSNPWSSNAITTTNANDLLVGFAVSNSFTASNLSSSGGWNLATLGTGVGGQSMIGEQIVSSTGTYNYAGNQAGANSSDEIGIFSFKQKNSAVLVSLAVTPANASIAQGATEQFTATGTYSDLSTQNLTNSVTWSSSSTTVVTINGVGLASGVGTGSTTIQATSGSINGSTSLTVTPPALLSLAVTPTNSSIVKNATQQFTATGTYSDGSQQNLTSVVIWSSSNTSVAPISSTGLATGAGTGSTTIQASSGSINASTTLTVTATLVSIAVAPTNPSIAKGATQQFTATGTYSDGTQQNLTNSATWTSASASVATINNTGLATATGTGSTTIQASSGPINGSTVLTVTAPTLASLAISPINPSIVKGTTQQFIATGTYSDGSQQNLTNSATWTSSNTTVATINSTGLATSVTTGTTTIQATSGTVSNSTGLTVSATGMMQLATDNFSRPNAPTLGPTWTPLIGAPGNGPLQIVGNQVQSVGFYPYEGKEMYYGGINWPADQYSEVQIVAVSFEGTEGPAVRMTSNDTGYLCAVYGLASRVGNNTVAIILDNAGTLRILAGSPTARVSTGDVVRCSVQGSTITMTDQTTSTTLLTVTDTTIPSGYPGLIDDTGDEPVSENVMANWAGGATSPSLSPQTLASDNFVRSNALNLGISWDIGPGHGPIQIVSDQVQPYPAGGPQPSKEHYVAYGPFPNDQWSELQVVLENTIGDIAAEVRASDTADTMYVCDVGLTGAPGSAQTRIVKVLNGTITPLIIDQTFSAVSPGDYIRGQVQGSLISLIDVTTGTLLLSTFDTDIASGYPGVSLQAVTGTPSNHIATNWSGGGFSQ